MTPPSRVCGCGATFAPRSPTNHWCSKPCATRFGKRARKAARDSVALAMVREWSPGQRARIRATALRMLPLGKLADAIASPEGQLVALIDQVTEQEAR